MRCSATPASCVAFSDCSSWVIAPNFSLTSVYHGVAVSNGSVDLFALVVALVLDLVPEFLNGSLGYAHGLGVFLDDHGFSVGSSRVGFISLVGVSFHSVSFTRSSLSISEYCCVKTVKSICEKLFS